MDGLSQARRAAALAVPASTWLRDEEALGGRAVAAVSSGARRRLRGSRCRIEPYWIKGGAAPRTAGPASAPGSAVERPARRTQGHTARVASLRRLAQQPVKCSSLRRPGYPTGGHRVNGRSCRTVKMRSAVPPNDSVTTPKESAARPDAHSPVRLLDLRVFRRR